MRQKDVVKEAFEQLEAMKTAAMDTAKNVLVEAMSTDLKAAVSKAMSAQLREESDQPADYHDGKKDKNLGSDRIGDEIEATGDTPNDDLADKGDGPAIIETGIEDIDDIEEMDHMEDDDDKDMMEMDFDDEDEDDDIEEMYEDDMEDEDEDDEEVIEVVEDEDMDYDEDEDEEEVKVESSIRTEVARLRKQNRKLRNENRKYERALVGVKNQMDEVNLFNARLAAATDLMRRVTLTKTQKERVVEHFDRARTVGEIKRTHRALYEGYRNAGKVVRKARVNRPNVQSVVTESTEPKMNESFNRLSQLAGL